MEAAAKVETRIIEVTLTMNSAQAEALMAICEDGVSWDGRSLPARTAEAVYWALARAGVSMGGGRRRGSETAPVWKD